MVVVDRQNRRDIGRDDLEREATTLDVSDVASYLQTTLGQRLVAYLAGLRDPKMVGQWAARKHSPRAWETEMRLRSAYRATRLVADAFDSKTAIAWLFGSNSYLLGDAPAYVLRHAQTPDDVRDVVPAAYAFVETP